jgi:tetratricopeptide (TPR) repeat protein
MGGMSVSRRRSACLALLGITMAAGCATTQATPEMQRLQGRDAYERALSAMQQRQVPATLSAFREAIALDPTVPIYHNNFGLFLLQQLGRPDLALQEFHAAAELDPQYADAHFNVGIARSEMSQWKEALEAYKKALGLPTLTVPHLVHHNLGLALYHLKRYQEAEASFRLALTLDPKMEGAYYNLGLVYVAVGRRDDARLAFKHARDLAPQSTFGQAARQKLKDLGGGG